VKSERMSRIKLSPTINIAATAILMKRQHIDVIDLSVGEPDFPTPQHIKDAAKKAIDENRTKYTINQGMLELREAIAHRILKDQSVRYRPEEIIVSNGAKQSLLNIIMAVTDRGDKVLVPAPYWVSYPEMVKLAGGVPVIINTRESVGFKLLPDQLRRSAVKNCRALILCNPSNPTGMVYSRDEMQALAEIIEQKNLIVIADEIYEKLVYDGFDFTSFAAVSDAMKDRTVIVNGVSKAYAMTGWRIGYAAGSGKIIENANIVQSHSTSSAPTISQLASIAAFSGPQDEIERMRAEFEQRRNFVFKKIQQIDGLSCLKPEGAFYVFPNASRFFGRKFRDKTIRNSYDLAYYLLEEAHVATVPGAAFGCDDNLRISYASSMENLEHGMERITAALAKLE
jgi:aspartate/methionine/tyrosine aminotransferase